MRKGTSDSASRACVHRSRASYGVWGLAVRPDVSMILPFLPHLRGRVPCSTLAASPVADAGPSTPGQGGFNASPLLLTNGSVFRARTALAQSRGAHSPSKRTFTASKRWRLARCRVRCLLCRCHPSSTLSLVPKAPRVDGPTTVGAFAQTSPTSTTFFVGVTISAPVVNRVEIREVGTLTFDLSSPSSEDDWFGKIYTR